MDSFEKVQQMVLKKRVVDRIGKVHEITLKKHKDGRQEMWWDDNQKNVVEDDQKMRW